MTYTPAGNLASLTHPPDAGSTATFQYTYDPDGKVPQIADPLGGSVTTTYAPKRTAGDGHLDRQRQVEQDAMAHSADGTEVRAAGPNGTEVANTVKAAQEVTRAQYTSTGLPTITGGDRMGPGLPRWPLGFVCQNVCQLDRTSRISTDLRESATGSTRTGRASAGLSPPQRMTPERVWHTLRIRRP